MVDYSGENSLIEMVHCPCHVSLILGLNIVYNPLTDTTRLSGKTHDVEQMVG